MTQALDWVHVTTSIPDKGLAETRVASAEERLELARMLDILSCDVLDVSYNIRPLNAERFRLTGRLKARVAQACVVSLEPVTADIDESFEIELYPREAAPTGEDEEDEQEILDAPDVEPFDNGRIDVGEIVFELLSAALDPYPRKEGAEFDWVDPKTAADPGAVSPFAALAKLKPKV